VRGFYDTQKAGEENGSTDIPRIIEENFVAFATLRYLPLATTTGYGTTSFERIFRGLILIY
jgi:hypothetical protein